MTMKNWSVSRKLGGGFGVVVLLLVAMTMTAIWSLISINRSIDAVLDQTQKSMIAASVGQDVRDIGNRLALILLTTDNDRRENILKGLTSARDRYKKNIEVLKETAITQQSKDILIKMEQTITDSRDANSKVIELSMSGHQAEALTLYNDKCVGALEKVYQIMDEVLKRREQRTMEIAGQAQSLSSTVRWVLVLGGILAAALAIVFGTVLSRNISSRLGRCAGFATGMSGGDMTQTLQIIENDEISAVGVALNEMGAYMRQMITDINDGVQTLASSSTELSAISGQMASGAMSISERASTVAAAAEESSANTSSVAAGMEQMTANLGSVAGATEQMSATIGEIASNSEKARAISAEATQQTQVVSTMMKELGRAAQEIGKVTEAISSISAQTNLLALNATIEAARAGAAGKGFAVVANEIKELAQQTATATEDIKGKISRIQASTSGAIGDIEIIAQVIKQVGEIVATIAVAIEEQSVVTKDVASNIAQATMGVKDSNDRVAQTASVSHSIAQDIAEVNMTISEISRGGEQVQFSAAELSQLAEQLKEMVGRFRI